MNLSHLDMSGPGNRSGRKVTLDSSCSSVTPAKPDNAANTSDFKTPSSKSSNRSLVFGWKTPSKTPGTPGRLGSKTPPRSGGDRFIPCRSATNFDLAHHLVVQKHSASPDPAASPTLKEYQRLMAENLSGGKSPASKVLSYNNKPPTAPQGHGSQLKVLYSNSKTGSPKRKTTRHIPQVPERILDAPDILDDYYLNLLDWSSRNLLAVSLGAHVYLWNASNGEINQLLEMEEEDAYVASVSWTKDGHCLAVGSSTGDVQLWDPEQKKCLRTMGGHTARVPALSWNNHILASGCRSGAIHLHDVRVARHHVGSLLGHAQEVCGLRWSPEGATAGGARYLASGANDNLLHVWEPAGNTSQPLHTFTQHQAAVKALAWCPWQSGVLASGGGTADRHIRFWNCNTGAVLNSVDTQSQVCALLWSTEYRELVSSHGFAHNQLILWKYPTMAKVAELTGHTSRVLQLAMSPDGSTVVSGAADETLRLWRCFHTDPDKRKAAAKLAAAKHTNSSLLRKGIR